MIFFLLHRVLIPDVVACEHDDLPLVLSYLPPDHNRLGLVFSELMVASD